eukprot:1159080-Pelagomonas_calceolata.AAC.11
MPALLGGEQCKRAHMYTYASIAMPGQLQDSGGATMQLTSTQISTCTGPHMLTNASCSLARYARDN